jgi:cytochrome oxidase assembly protein ShyY1
VHATSSKENSVELLLKGDQTTLTYVDSVLIVWQVKKKKVKISLLQAMEAHRVARG